MSLVDTDKGRNWGISERTIAEILTPFVHQESLPKEITLPQFSHSIALTANYTLDTDLQNKARQILEKHNPDYGVFVAISPESGEILAMVDSTRAGQNQENFSLINTFPAASISKIITAVAAVNEQKANGTTVIPFNGKTTSLYKKNVFNHKKNKWTREFSLNESFAKSVNTIFGRLGAVTLGGETMLDYAHRLGFNGRFASDFSFNNGVVELDTMDPWQVAEMASGYTTNNTLSPLHGAVLAATAVNGGKLVAPVIVDSLIDPHGIPIYIYDKPGISEAMSESSSQQLHKMMQSTVRIGSARRYFRGFNKGDMSDVKVGGKTGSLTGFKPKGKYDWFVGFGEKGDDKIAFAVLCINKEKWYVKSATLAREVLEYYFASPTTSS